MASICRILITNSTDMDMEGEDTYTERVVEGLGKGVEQKCPLANDGHGKYHHRRLTSNQ
jgi:hypothetical protein